MTPEQDPDLMVRYFVESQKSVIVGTNTNLGVYGPHYGYHWGFIYYSMETSTTHMSVCATTVILLRHAEKATQPDDDPPLTAAADEYLNRAKIRRT